MVISNLFSLGDFVYLKTDTEQVRRIVTGISVRPTGLIYELCAGEKTSSHYEFEISETVDELIKL